MKSVLLLMDSSYGWKKIVHKNYTFWYKVYILGDSFDNIANTLVAINSFEENVYSGKADKCILEIKKYIHEVV